MNYKLILYRIKKEMQQKHKPKGDALTPKGINHSYVPKSYLEIHPLNDIEKVKSPNVIIF